MTSPSQLREYNSIFSSWLRIHQASGSQRLASFSEEDKELLDPGWLRLMSEKVPSGSVDQAFTDKEAVTHILADFHKEYDFIIIPGHLTEAQKAAPCEVDYLVNGKPWWDKLDAVHAHCIFNMTGQPAAVVPCGFTEKTKHPVSMQIIGDVYDDVRVMQLSYEFEQLCSF